MRPMRASLSIATGGVMKVLLSALGAVVLLLGLLFMAQGAGIVRWPAESFMIDASAWIWRGCIVAVIGVVLILLGRRR
jgi:hypothetical protein